MKRIQKFKPERYITKILKSNAPFFTIAQEKAMGLRMFDHPKDVKIPKISAEDKTKEFYGHFSPINHKFNEVCSQKYKNLMIDLQTIDKKYSKSSTIEERIDFSRDSMNKWNEFLEDKKGYLNEELVINDNTKGRVTEVFQRFKRRNEISIPSKEVLNFLGEFSKYYDFDVFVHPSNLLMMINPHWGYMAKFQKVTFTIDQFFHFLEKELVSTQFRAEGNELMANRVSAHNYWSLIDKDLKGFVTASEFYELLDAMAIDVSDMNMEKFKKDFEIVLERVPNEFLGVKTELYRFRLFELIFLERCAIY